MPNELMHVFGYIYFVKEIMLKIVCAKISRFVPFSNFSIHFYLVYSKLFSARGTLIVRKHEYKHGFHRTNIFKPL